MFWHNRIDRQADRPLIGGITVLVVHSAGGQLALWAAQHQRRPPQAVVSISGPADLTYAALHGDRKVRAFLGGYPDQVPEHYALADPSRSPAAAAVLLIHGTRDRVVPIGVALHFREDMPAQSPPGLIEIDGATHTSLVTPGHVGYSEVLAATAELVDRVRFANHHNPS